MSKLIKVVFVSGDTLKKELGEFAPEQVTHIAKLAKEFGVAIGEEEYEVSWMGLELENQWFEIVISKKQPKSTEDLIDGFNL